MAGNSGAIRAGRAFVEIFADSSALVRGLKSAEKSLRTWGLSVSAMGRRMMGVGAAILTPLVGASVKASLLADELKDMADITGASVDGLQALSYAADINDVNMQSLTKSMVFMHKSLFALRSGSKSAVEAFNLLGLSVHDMSGLSPDKQFELIAERLAAIKDPSLRAALAVKIFGRAGAELLPLINQGKNGFAAYRKELERLGVMMGQEDVEAGAKLHEELKKMWWVIKNGLVASIGSALVPIMRNMANWFTETAAATARWVKQNRGVVTMAFWIGAALLGAGAAMIVFGNAILWTSKVCGIIATGFTLIKTALVWLFSPLGTIIALTVAAVSAFLYFSGYGAQALSWLGARFNELKQDAIKAFGGISKALAKGDIALAAKIAWLFVKMEWLKAKQYLLEIWLSLKAKVLEYWYALVYSLVDAWNSCLYGVQVGWIETVAFLKSLWIGFKEFFGNTVDWIAEKMMGVWIWWQKLMDPKFDDKFAKEYVKDQLTRDKKDRADQTNKDLLAVDKERLEKRNNARQEYESLLQGSEQSLTNDLQTMTDESARRLKENADALAKIKAEFDASIAAANETAPEKKAKKPPSPKDWSANGMDKASTVGTFSAFGLGQMGVGSVMQKIADFTQRTAEATEEIVENMGDGSLEFGE